MGFRGFPFERFLEARKLLKGPRGTTLSRSFLGLGGVSGFVLGVLLLEFGSRARGVQEPLR